MRSSSENVSLLPWWSSLPWNFDVFFANYPPLISGIETCLLHFWIFQWFHCSTGDNSLASLGCQSLWNFSLNLNFGANTFFIRIITIDNSENSNLHFKSWGLKIIRVTDESHSQDIFRHASGSRSSESWCNLVWRKLEIARWRWAAGLWASKSCLYT